MINIQDRRECFFDNYLIDEEKTTAEHRLHKPVRRGVILEMNMPWEGNYTTFFSIIKAEGKWRAYYVTTLSKNEKYICYAESEDGEHWARPSLGIVEFNGSRDNNIIMNLEMLAEYDFTSFDNMSVFYDENPSSAPDEKYKMVAWWCGHAALVALFSADGIHFNKMRLVTDEGEFDSQNRAFWSEAHGKYFTYFRGEHTPSETTDKIDRSYTDKVASALYDPDKFMLREPGAGTFTFMRDVQVSESDDFVNWSKPSRIRYTGTDYQLYNNVVFPYPRAPHILIGFPLRYVERKAWTKNYEELCGKSKRIERMAALHRFGLAVTDGLFMASRDGYSFTKYDEALLPPPPENPEAFVYGDGTASAALIEVPSEIPGADNEYMLVLRESFRCVEGRNKLVKYTSRLDGFVSMHAGGKEELIVTKPFIYSGSDLYVNIATSARGYAYFTLCADGEEYTSVEVFGNSTDKRVRFDDDDTVSKLCGKEITLKVRLFDSDLYSIKFS